MNQIFKENLSKVPAVTLGFGVIKIAATTLGETGGDAVTMSMNLGYLVGTLIFGVLLVVALSAQLAVHRFHPFLYWAVVVATTTVGTTLADFVDRSLGIGYVGGSTLLLVLLFASLGTWRAVCGSVSVDLIASRKVELFYWITILFSRTLLFWAAFVLTRPLGATVGDLLDKPRAKGGLEFSATRLLPCCSRS